MKFKSYFCIFYREGETLNAIAPDFPSFALSQDSSIDFTRFLLLTEKALKSHANGVALPEPSDSKKIIDAIQARGLRHKDQTTEGETAPVIERVLQIEIKDPML